MTNGQFSKTKEFKDICWTANIVMNLEKRTMDNNCMPTETYVKPTQRQASKYRMKKGLAYMHGRHD